MSGMLQAQMLPTCDEYDPLEAHLEELEEPGTNFLQDFISAPQPTQSYTPLSNSNGYTSEESDYSVVTPSDEQRYHDKSFLTDNELVGDLGADMSHEQPQKLAGKVIKGKTSKYRGVTQTSKTSWGAKYSAKRITNTCKTPEEAAHAYDAYLKANYPQKFAKFANFCDKCGKFVNPLGLPQFQSECKCSALLSSKSPKPEMETISPKKEISNRQQITTPTAAMQSLVPPSAPSPGYGPSTISLQTGLNTMETSNQSYDMNPVEQETSNILSRRSSLLSTGSLKFSFSEDTEKFFEESFIDVAKMSSNRGGESLSEKRDSLPIAVISSAVDSFTRGDNLDQIIKDINRSSTSSLLNENPLEEHIDDSSMGSSAPTVSSTGSGNMNELSNQGEIQNVRTTDNSLGFDVADLDELSSFFLSENNPATFAQPEMANFPLMQQNTAMLGAQNSHFKKNHSLEFDSEESIGGSTRTNNILNDIKLEHVEMMNPFMMAPVTSSPGFQMPPLSPATSIIDIQTRFLEKYWRNDRKNIQCFPYCPEHGDYYRVRIENLQHRCKGVCRAPVKAHVSIPSLAGASVTQPSLLVLARCNSTFSRNMTLTGQQSFSLLEMKNLQNVSAVGVIDNYTPLGKNGVQFDVTFHPDVWKFEFDLPKKRRHVHCSSPTVSSYGGDGDASNDPLIAEFLYFFEIDVFYSRDKTTFERLGHMESMNFQIGNTRTLLRQRNKMVEEFNGSGGPVAHTGQNDSDKMVNADELPEKKKVKVNLGQHELLSGRSNEDWLLSNRRLTGGKMSIEDISDERFSSPSKQSNINSSGDKATILTHEAGSSDHLDSADVWTDGGARNDLLQNDHLDYHSFVSPKQNSGQVQNAEWSATVPITDNAHVHQAAVLEPLTTDRAYSLPKLLTYSIACVPLSVVFIPVGLFLLLGLLILPPSAASIVSLLDTLSDAELSRANGSCITTDTRMVLNRLTDVVDSADKRKGGLFRYHGRSDVWGRLLYFSGVKFVISMISTIPALILALFAGLLYPIRPASAAIANGACTCALWSREYTRKTTGKPLAHSAGDSVGVLV